MQYSPLFWICQLKKRIILKKVYFFGLFVYNKLIKSKEHQKMNIEQWKIAKKEKNLSYDDLAKITGYSRSTITNIFCGYIEFPRYETIQAIEKALGITSDKNEQENEIYTEQEKRLVKAFRTLIPSMQENILELVESMSTNVKGKGNYA